MKFQFLMVLALTLVSSSAFAMGKAPTRFETVDMMKEINEVMKPLETEERFAELPGGCVVENYKVTAPHRSDLKAVNLNKDYEGNDFLSLSLEKGRFFLANTMPCTRSEEGGVIRITCERTDIFACKSDDFCVIPTKRMADHKMEFAYRMNDGKAEVLRIFDNYGGADCQ